MSNFNVESVAKKENYVEKDSECNIKKIIFPHQIKVGLTNNSVFNATISGSIHHTNEGKSYLIAGNNVTITSESNGQITISSAGGGGGGGSPSYGGGSTGYSSLASEGLTTYSPEGSQTVSAPAAADYSAFLNESLQLYSYAESQGRKQS